MIGDVHSGPSSWLLAKRARKSNPELVRTRRASPLQYGRDSLAYAQTLLRPGEAFRKRVCARTIKPPHDECLCCAWDWLTHPDCGRVYVLQYSPQHSPDSCGIRHAMSGLSTYLR